MKLKIRIPSVKIQIISTKQVKKPDEGTVAWVVPSLIAKPICYAAFLLAESHPDQMHIFLPALSALIVFLLVFVENSDTQKSFLHSKTE